MERGRLLERPQKSSCSRGCAVWSGQVHGQWGGPLSGQHCETISGRHEAGGQLCTKHAADCTRRICPTACKPACSSSSSHLQLAQALAAAQKGAGGLPAVGAHQAQTLQVASQQVCRCTKSIEMQRVQCWKPGLCSKCGDATCSMLEAWPCEHQHQAGNAPPPTCHSHAKVHGLAVILPSLRSQGQPPVDRGHDAGRTSMEMMPTRKAAACASSLFVQARPKRAEGAAHCSVLPAASPYGVAPRQQPGDEGVALGVEVGQVARALRSAGAAGGERSGVTACGGAAADGPSPCRLAAMHRRFGRHCQRLHMHGFSPTAPLSKFLPCSCLTWANSGRQFRFKSGSRFASSDTCRHQGDTPPTVWHLRRAAHNTGACRSRFSVLTRRQWGKAHMPWPPRQLAQGCVASCGWGCLGRRWAAAGSTGAPTALPQPHACKPLVCARAPVSERQPLKNELEDFTGRRAPGRHSVLLQ